MWINSFYARCALMRRTLLIITLLIIMPTLCFAQVIDLHRADYMVDFPIYSKSIDLAFDTFSQDTAPDSIRMRALQIASGYIAGIKFHYERNRDKISIYEQVETVADDLDYTGYEQNLNSIYTFNYTLWMDYDIVTDSKCGTSYQGHGVSDLENMVDAREDARDLAFADAIGAALRMEYTQQNIVLPGVVDGRIMWYEIMRDEVDTENGFYVFDINAWVRFENDEE